MSISRERAQNLINYTREELEAFKAKQVHRLSTNENLRGMFGYAHVGSFYPTLQREGLAAERRRLFLETGGLNPIPSRDLAWMLGLLSGVGHVGIETGAITLGTPEEELIRKYRYLGERLFQTNMTTNIQRQTSDSRDYVLAQFHSRRHARMIGDLRRSQWPRTLAQRHEWLLRNEAFIWQFLEGLYEVNGFIEKRQPLSIKYSTYYSASANSILELLTRVGIDNPVLIRNRKRKEGVQGIGILNVRDAKFFAEHVHSVIPAKEAKLGIIRYRDTRLADSRKVSREEALSEWERLRNKLGHYPRSYEIQALRKAGETRYSVSVYTKRFGNGTFSSAKDELEKQFPSLEESSRVSSQLRRAEKKPLEQREPKKRGAKPKFTTGEVIEEWGRLREILGRPPKSHEIDPLKKKGLTKFSSSVYIYRFGLGTFVRAREEIEKHFTPIEDLEDKSSNKDGSNPHQQEVVKIDRRRLAGLRFPMDEVLSDWFVAMNYLGRSPTSDQVNILKRQGIMRFSAGVFLKRFGNGSWVTARATLEKLTRTL